MNRQYPPILSLCFVCVTLARSSCCIVSVQPSASLHNINRFSLSLRLISSHKLPDWLLTWLLWSVSTIILTWCIVPATWSRSCTFPTSKHRSRSKFQIRPSDTWQNSLLTGKLKATDRRDAAQGTRSDSFFRDNLRIFYRTSSLWELTLSPFHFPSPKTFPASCLSKLNSQLLLRSGQLHDLKTCDSAKRLTWNLILWNTQVRFHVGYTPPLLAGVLLRGEAAQVSPPPRLCR